MPRVVVFDRTGGPEVLQVVEEPVVEPGPGEVRVRVEAFAVNPLDLMMRSGTAPVAVPLPHARLGVEGTGVVDAVGTDVGGLQVGDPVVLAAVPDAWVRGSYADYLTIDAGLVIRRPDGLDVTEAAAVWVGYSTAYGALIEKAGMRPGDTVLITAASGAVGRAALQIVNQLGAVGIAVTRHSAKREELLAAGAAAVIATDRDDVIDVVRHYTGGAGADIVLDLVTGPGQSVLIEAGRPGGMLVAAGFLDPRPTPVPADPPLTVVGYRSFEHTLDPVVVQRMAAFLGVGVRLGVVHPVIDRVFALDDVVQAHRKLEAGGSTGKIVVTV